MATSEAVPKVLPKPDCDNHPGVESVLTTDGKSFQVMNLCPPCVPAAWR